MLRLKRACRQSNDIKAARQEAELFVMLKSQDNKSENGSGLEATFSDALFSHGFSFGLFRDSNLPLIEERSVT